MNVQSAEELVVEAIKRVLEEEATSQLGPTTELIGNDPVLDSMQLVEVCVSLEDAAEDLGFEFDWTSETAMSRSQSMFRNIRSLSEEFSKQSESI